MVTSFFILLILVIVGAALANQTPVPNEVAWCILGFAVAFLPWFPPIQFDPRIALFFFLPPLIYASAVDLPWPEFRDNLRPIAVLAIGLVVVTAAVAGLVAHHLMSLPWGVAIVLGAVISPTDPVAASAVAARVGMPRRLVAILEGEGLVNDAVALTIFRVALGAVVTGASLPLGSGLIRFAAILIGEPIYGWLLGVGIAWLRARITDPRLEIAVSLLTPFAAYLIPEHLGGSGILATVATGMYIGERRSTLVPARTRLHATSFWQMIVFLLNGILFLAAGIELRRVIASTGAGSQVLWWGLAVSGTVIVVRLVWCVAASYLLLALRRVIGSEKHPEPFRHLMIIAWSGIRGPISLAAVLSIPAYTGGASFPEYQLVLFVSSVVIICTLFLQGISLPPLVHLLGVSKDAGIERRRTHEEKSLGRTEAAHAALECLARLEERERIHEDLGARLRRYYEDQLADVESRAEPQNDGNDEWTSIVSRLLNAERARVLELRGQGRISDEALSDLERNIDLRESLLG